MEGEPKSNDLFQLKQKAQVALMEYMMAAGVIQTQAEYADDGHAEMFDELSRGCFAISKALRGVRSNLNTNFNS